MNKSEKTYQNRFTGLILIIALFGINFVSLMGYLNYKTTAINLEEQIITNIEFDIVDGIETSISFGKSLENYYGMTEIFHSFNEQFSGPQPFVLSKEGELLYYGSGLESDDSSAIQSFLAKRDFSLGFSNIDEEGSVIKSGRVRMSVMPIYESSQVKGYFCSLYNEDIFKPSLSSIRSRILILDIITMVVIFIVLYIYITAVKYRKDKDENNLLFDESSEKPVTVMIIAAGIILLSVFSIYAYQQDYKEKVRDSIRISVQTLESQIEKVESSGVDLAELDGLKEYIYERVMNMEMLRSVRVSRSISEVNIIDEESDLIMFEFDAFDNNEKLLLEAEISDDRINQEMHSIILILLSTMIILLIFVFELNKLIDLFLSEDRITRRPDSFSEKKISITLRFTGFLCSTAEYICVPYCAMLIRDSGESLFGLTVGMTAALPLTVEGLAQMIAMLGLSKYTAKLGIKRTLLFSSILMISCNVISFAAGGALVIILCRAAAGFAYAGFKGVSNFLITKGYETEEGRSENITQDNAGLLAGATCGAGLGAILSANTGYSTTFLFSAVIFIAYLAGTFTLVPWSAVFKHSQGSAEQTEHHVNTKELLKMITSGEMLKYILFIGIPLNIGVMLCVTLIPAICQANDISSIMLSYCYIANGLAGIYIGPAMVSSAKKVFGLEKSLAFIFALTAVSIFILKVPPVVLMIMISSAILGLLDGFGTPLAIERFMDLDIVRKSVDESTALIFSLVLSYVLLTFAPMIAELMVMPSKGAIQPLLIGASLYAVAAFAVLFFKSKKNIDN